VQTCIVHLVRSSLKFVNWKDRKAMAADLKLIYRAATAEMAEVALAEFRAKYPKHQVVADVWSRNWERVIPFFEFPPEIRKIFPDSGQAVQTYFKWNAVTPAYFQAMEIPIIRGRTFAEADHSQKVVIVNGTFVERFLGKRQPLGVVFLGGGRKNPVPDHWGRRRHEDGDHRRGAATAAL
jgi:hypothetical protein